MWQMTGLYKKGSFKSHVSINQKPDKSVLARAMFFDENDEFI
ncbi:hypothetical protein AVT_26555 [Bacillus tropicus]|nr:hypothetical protein [Bacillus tropicus]WBO90275.1 hypothetical protein AVT_26555 [Bacillus tropicus]